MKIDYQYLVIYYFSGTGNAKQCAKWIIDEAEKRDVQTSLVNIDRFSKIEIPKLTEKTLIGFCYPTHGFNAPPIMLKFMSKFPRMKNTDVFFLNTRAGMKLAKIFTPGISGIALLLPALIFLVKGFHIRSMRPADLPSNWIPVHPGVRKKVVESIVENWEKVIRKFANKLLEKKRVWRALIDLPIDILIIPISVGYYFFGRFFLAKTYIATSECNSCGLCSEKCPVHAIKTINGRPFWTYKCESCMRCLNNCPKRAIHTPHTYIAGLIIISSLANSLLCEFLVNMKWIPGIDSRWYSKTETAISTIIFMATIYGGYWLIHKLMQNRIIDRIITYTSLTKFRFWRRYKFPRKHKVNTQE